MQTDWRETTWGAEVSLEYGKAIRGYSEAHGQFRVFGSNGPVGWTENALANGPGVILGRKGAYRGVQFSRDPFWVIDTAYYIVPKTDLDMRWLYYAVKHYKLGEIDDGSPIPSTTRSAVYAQELLVPSPGEQRAIARVLGALDDKIELNRRMNATLEETARALFRSWFVDFDPVRAKAAGRAPAGMDAATAALFPDAFAESEAGTVPAGWKVAPIGDCVQAVGGGTPTTANPEYWEGGTVPWATPKDLSGLVSPVLLGTERKVTPEGLKKISSGLLPKGTVLLSSRAPIGYLAVAEMPVAVNQGFIAMVCDKALPNLYVLYWAKENMDAIEGRANGSTFMEISKAAFRPIPALVPSTDVLALFMAAVEPLHRQIVENVRETAVLSQTRDELIPKLVSGDLRLPDGMVSEFGEVPA